MKINGYDLDTYAAGLGEDFEEGKFNREKSLACSFRRVKDIQELGRVITSLNTSSQSTNLYLEVRSKWEDCLDQPMVYYRGYQKNASSVFDEVDKMMKSFDIMGLQRGDEIVLCMSNVPEVLTILLAASQCGLVIRAINVKDSRVHIKEIFSKVNGKKLFIGTDDKYARIQGLVTDAGFMDKVIVSLTDSLEKGVNPFESYDNLYKFTNKVLDFKKQDQDIMSYSEFLGISDKWVNDDNGFSKRCFYVPDSAIWEPFTITNRVDYFTGNSSEVVRTNAAYVFRGKINDWGLLKMPSRPNDVDLAHIPICFDTGLNCIIDGVSNGHVVAFEPIYHPKFLFYSMVINSPTTVFATRSFLIETIKTANHCSSDMVEFAFWRISIMNAVDEPILKSEEDFINKGLEEVKAGSKYSKRPTTLSVSASAHNIDNWSFTSFKGPNNPFSNFSSRRDSGFQLYPTCTVAVLNEFGAYCDYDEYGRLGIHNCAPSNPSSEIDDCEGHKWQDCGVWGAMLKDGRVSVKGDYHRNFELSNGQRIPYFMIEDKLSESEGVLSCEIVRPEPDNQRMVAHIELTPEGKLDARAKEDIFYDLEKRALEVFPLELVDNLVYNMRPLHKSFPLVNNGMRSISTLEKEGIEGACKPRLCDTWDTEEIVPASEHFQYLDSRDEDFKAKVLQMELPDGK